MSERSSGAVRRILVATDLSPRSDRALRRATLIAARLGASLELVHVVDGERPRRMVEAERQEADAILADTVKTNRELDGVAAGHRVVIDDPFSGILSAADEIEADLIVVGPHRSSFRDVFAGTTVERVVRRSKLPLLVAIQPPSASYEKILLALDFDDASRAAAQGAARLGLFERTAVTLMNAFDVPGAGMMRRTMEMVDGVEDYIDQEKQIVLTRLREMADELELPTIGRVMAINGPPSRAILDAAHDQAADLVVLGTSKMGSLKRMLIGSVAEQVLRDAERDILIIPAGPNEN